ncbi:L,D-transpeptidase family protein [Shewanella eurypsychrophilus]|uniref:L,D-transpeptidase family protein n=1 Tax=Shewanella eurypsychrophilus TaxID=2593656 RepID=A0ABX6V6X7_9GAMM|nr:MULTISPECIES: L,D-transpeptidase family protein [Shewanella]QFU23084.1 L,D-transpeptidase family protein [Shewanella sp. YLB-09]QPG58367.1 L,D-transpeptidase family protein [Shewanella eurypsychrophilus]
MLGRSSSYALLVTLLLLNINPSFAIERAEAAYQSLAFQIQFAQLIRPSKQLDNDYRALTLGTNELKKTRVEHILSDLQEFWTSVGVPNNASKSVNYTDLLAHVFALEPLSSDYLATSNKVRFQLWLSQQEEWGELRIDRWLEEGDVHSLVPEIRRRLLLLGDVDSSNNSDQLKQDIHIADAHFIIGVKSFQQRHGLKRDGIIGPETLRWINLKPFERARLLAMNFVDKTRFLASVEPRFLLINIPAFQLELISHGRIELQSRVIVGKPYRQTPVLSSQISNLVINPSWRVPRRLLTRDLLPKVREDGGYIEQRNFDVFDRHGELVSKSPQEWQDLAHGRFPYRLVQKPGEGNTLGRYKFFFKNKYNVYIHDTSDKDLFNESNRALSSGCIRIENVEGLANWMASHLVKDKQTWVEMQIERRKTQWFSLNDTLPVHLVYWTAWIDENGNAQYRNDIYHQNSVLNTAIAHLTP